MPRDTFPLEDGSLPVMYSDYADYHSYYTLNNGTPGTGMASNSNTLTPGSVFVQRCYSPFFNGQVCSYLPEPHLAAMLEPPALDATCSMQTDYENMGYYLEEPISSIADFSTVHQSHPYSTYTVPVGNETPFHPQITNAPEISNIISPTWQSQLTTSEQPYFQVHDTYCSKAFPSDPNCRPSNNMHTIGYQDSQHPSPTSASKFAQMRKKGGPVITVTIPQNWTKATKSPSTQTYDSTQLDNGLSHLSTSTEIHRLEDGPGTETISKLASRRPSNFTSTSGPVSPGEINELEPHSDYCVKSETRSTDEPEAEPARTSPHYEAYPHSNGLYYCPFKSKENCPHDPTKLKCSYDKYIDSHLKPYRCKIPGCQELRFSSTACRLRHEREAHGSHGHGLRPYLCLHADCERSKIGHGFPRSWNRNDHMKRVHYHTFPLGDSTGSPSLTSSETSTSADTQIARKRTAPEDVRMESEKRHKVLVQGQLGKPATGQSTEVAKAHELRKSMQRQWRDCHADFHHRFHNLQGPSDFQTLAQLRIDADALYAMSRQLHQLG